MCIRMYLLKQEIANLTFLVKFPFCIFLTIVMLIQYTFMFNKKIRNSLFIPSIICQYIPPGGLQKTVTCWLLMFALLFSSPVLGVNVYDVLTSLCMTQKSVINMACFIKMVLKKIYLLQHHENLSSSIVIDAIFRWQAHSACSAVYDKLTNLYNLS